MSGRIDTALVLLPWNMALTQRVPQAVLFHTDRRVQYASAAFRQLAAGGAVASMSRQGLLLR